MISQTQITALQPLPGVAWITALKRGDPGPRRGRAPAARLFDERNLFRAHVAGLPRRAAGGVPQPGAGAAAPAQAGGVAGGDEPGTGARPRHGRPRPTHRAGRHRGARGQGRQQVKGGETRPARYSRRQLRLPGGRRVGRGRGGARRALRAPHERADGAPDADETVRSYKRLSQVERAFRRSRPWTSRCGRFATASSRGAGPHLPLPAGLLRRVAHAGGLRPLLFADEDQAAKATRDPVAPATRSNAALRKSTRSSSTTGRWSTASAPCSRN